jgi:DNA processing protein
MKINSISRKILYLMVNNGVKSSEFIKIYRNNNGDINRTLKYFLKYKNLKLQLITGKECNTNSFDDVKYGSYERIIDFILKNEIGLLEISSIEYPAFLKQIHLPPPLLFFKGEKIKNAGFMIAVVGSRKCTKYGRDAAEYISKNLSGIGITIVSGMAAGIDGYAHKAALEEAGGSIGVLGCGIDIEYPPENGFLFKDILKNGSIITEFMPGTPPFKSNFPVRNRIISGLCGGVVVIEAGEKSGAIITCEAALNQNREVMAVPGSIFSTMSKGCHRLIKEGAKLVDGIDDILEEFSQYKDKISGLNKKPDNISNMDSQHNLNLTGDDKRIYEFIGFKPISIEEIVKYSGLKVSNVLKIIASLEMRNLIREDSFNKYIRLF